MTIAQQPTRRPWHPPVVERIHTRDAELGANPVIGEGAFGKGS
jgi:hypothetical protein